MEEQIAILVALALLLLPLLLLVALLVKVSGLSASLRSLLGATLYLRFKPKFQPSP